MLCPPAWLGVPSRLRGVFILRVCNLDSAPFCDSHIRLLGLLVITRVAQVALIIVFDLGCLDTQVDLRGSLFSI